jgi:hypothetical protein
MSSSLKLSIQVGNSSDSEMCRQTEVVREDVDTKLGPMRPLLFGPISTRIAPPLKTTPQLHLHPSSIFHCTNSSFIFYFTMHSLTFLPFLASGAIAALGATSDNYRDYEWSYHPDSTADEYVQHGSKVPPVAAAVTTVVEDSSYVVKLDCLGCPFRVRAHEGEYFTAEPDNSLVCRI